MRVLDLGGRVQAWTSAPVRPAHVVILNIEPPLGEVADGIELRAGDACAPPPDLVSGTFDLVYSNSTIEHVGGHARRLAFADTVRGAAAHHWVQTPYRYFPVEPHWVFPGFQFLPMAARAGISASWPLGWMHDLNDPPIGRYEHLPYAIEVELLSRTEMRHYFPKSELLWERFAGLTKSLIAVQ